MNVDAFLETLPMMGLGMLGIFLITILIMCVVGLLNFLTGNKENAEDRKN